MSAQSAAYRWDEQDWYEDQGHYGYGSDDTEDDAERQDWGDAHDELEGTSKAEHFAHSLMRSAAPLWCAATLFAPPDRGDEPLFAWLFEGKHIEHDPDAMHTENKEVELTDPEERVARQMPDQWGNQDYGQRLRRVRSNPETGYLSGGESTAIHLGCIPVEMFAGVVEGYLEHIDQTQSLSDDNRAAYREFAMSKKRDGNERDVDILEELIAAVETATDHQ